jgi:DNA-binding LytR/AlgR family response regulator
MLTAIAIDDEPIALEVIKSHASRIPFLDLKACFTNAFEAVDILRSQKIDLLFLDIKMPDISGIDFLESLPVRPMVIFTTAYSEHAVQSFELDAIDYLLKPYSLSRFLKACNKANEQHMLRKANAPATSDSVFIKSGYDQVRVALDDILYAESSGNYVQFVLKEKKIMSRLTMTEAEALLPLASFIRIHRSYIAARRRITRIERTAVWLEEVSLPVGANYIAELANLGR